MTSSTLASVFQHPTFNQAGEITFEDDVRASKSVSSGFIKEVLLHLTFPMLSSMPASPFWHNQTFVSSNHADYCKIPESGEL